MRHPERTAIGWARIVADTEGPKARQLRHTVATRIARKGPSVEVR